MEWEEIHNDGHTYTQRMKTKAGWLVRVVVWDEDKDKPTCISLAHFDDQRHEWGMPRAVISVKEEDGLVRLEKSNDRL